MMCFWPPHLFSEWVLGCYYVTWYIYLDFVHFKIGAGIYIPLDARQHESDWANRKYNNFTFSLTTPDLFVRVAPGYSFTLLLKYSYFCFIWSLDTDECWFGESLESKSIDIECNIQHTLILYKTTWCSIAASSTSNMPGLLPAPEL